jgi:hypothetical protein
MLMVEGQAGPIHYHDPIPLALASLFAACPDSRPLLDSFLEARGVPVVLRVLRQSNCTIALGYSVEIIIKLLSRADTPGRPNRCQDVAEELHQSGAWCHWLSVMQSKGNAG